MIAVDWGTTRCRAYRVRGGAVVDRRDAAAGILQVDRAAFAPTLRELVGPWLVDGEARILLSGMIGSRNGWVETGYVASPASVEGLAAALVPVPFDGAAVRLVPGVATCDTAGVPEFMRGEEAQIFGTDIETGVVCLPGSHSKWVQVAGAQIRSFTTFLTGEAFASLRAHTILAKSIAEAPLTPAAFDAGVARSADAGGLLHHLFGVRALALVGRLTEAAAGSYLSGLLIGHEVRHALPTADVHVHIVGTAELGALYARAVALCGARARQWSDETAALGLDRIAERAQWT